MPLELGIWRIDSDTHHRIHPASLDLEARLEEILHRDVSIIAPNWMVIGRQVRTIHGKLIDLLCMDRDGNLVVVELKRGMTDREIVSQLLDYGSWITTLRDEEIARIRYRQAGRTFTKGPILVTITALPTSLPERAGISTGA